MADKVLHIRRSVIIAPAEPPGFAEVARAASPRPGLETNAVPPVVVDMDGALLRSDIFLECVVSLLKHKPWVLLLLPLWWLRGGAYLKAQVARNAAPEIATLPVHERLLEWLVGEHAKGRSIHLVSDADEALVQQVADRFGIFASARGGSERSARFDEDKFARLEARLGAHFTYVGSRPQELAIWRRCGSGVLVGRAIRLQRRLPPTIEVQSVFDAPQRRTSDWKRALRLHQWSKNALVFVPALLAGRITDPATMARVGLGFLAFGLLASATYLLNDLLDLGEDRAHRTKRYRPLAAGALPLRDALIAIPVLGALAAIPLLILPPHFASVALLYLCLTIAYSIRIKQALMLDVIVLAILFTLRILAGIAALGAPMSPWLLAFSMFFFLSLACIKRYTECLMIAAAGKVSMPGRAYRAGDAPWLMAMGAASGFCAMATFFIYLVEGSSPVRLYARPQLMWLVCVILGYWLSRIWALTARGEMADDPVVFAMKDRLSLVLGGLIAITVLLAARI